MFYLGDPDQGFVSSVPDLELMDRQENAILHKLLGKGDAKDVTLREKRNVSNALYFKGNFTNQATTHLKLPVRRQPHT